MAFSSLDAAVSVRGAATILSASAGVEVMIPGKSSSSPAVGEMPSYIPGLFSSRAEHGASLFLHTSNHVNLYFEGKGFFAIERFDDVLDSDEGKEGESGRKGQSRMILNLRKGVLMVDSREMGDGSFILETPFGRVSGAQAWWFASIEFDQRSGIYDFTIACAEGNLRLTNLNKETFSIFRGQRIAGAGSFIAPSIEIGEHTDQTRDRFGDFAALVERFDPDTLDRDALHAQIQKMPELGENKPELYTSEDVRTSGKRPIVIEFAPRPRPITPFRAEVEPSSNFQADIF